MFFTFVRLHKCKRFSLKGTQTITIRPTSKTQLVLGTNGSGKSSLLKIGFTVMPASSKNFFPGGFHHVKLVHAGHHYELKSTFDKKPEHSFIRDGEELNKGKTETVQKELVREYFRMTQEIHNLLTGGEIFTNMSPLRRRDWITHFSSSDFQYVLDLFNRIKKAHRDAGAVVKHNTNRLTTETAKLRSPEETEVLNQKSTLLRDELGQLMMRVKPELSRQLGNLINQFDDRYARLKQALQEGLRHTIRTHDTKEYYEIANLVSWMEDCKRRIDLNQGKLYSLGEEFQHIDAQMNKLKSIEDIDEGTLRKDRQELEARLNGLQNALRCGLKASEYPAEPMEGVKVERFLELYREVPAQHHDLYDNDTIASHRKRVEDLYPRINEARQKVSNIEGRLEHIARCHTVECPNCSHLFKPGVGEDDVVKLTEALNKGKDYIQRHQSVLEESQTYLHEAEHYRMQMEHLYRFRQQHGTLSGLWRLIDAAGGFTENMAVVDTIRRFQHDMEMVAEIRDIEQRLSIIRESLNKVDELGGQGDSIRERYHQIHEKVNEHTELVRSEGRYYDHLHKVLLSQQKLDQYKDGIEALSLALCQTAEQIVECFVQIELQDEIKKRQISLAMIEQSITENEVQQGIVNDIQREITTMDEREKALKILMDTLSPTEGLIAEQIGVFINAVIDRMNAVINSVWGYNLSIKSCDVSSGELDYKFPLCAIKESDPVPDVADGSDSQVDIVNLAFKLVAYRFLHLEGYPLYLDELGRTFDGVHRHNLVPVVKDLIEDDQYSQVFIISHFVEGQGSYQNGQIIVLDDSHLSLKTAYNEHVVIE